MNITNNIARTQDSYASSDIIPGETRTHTGILIFKRSTFENFSNPTFMASADVAKVFMTLSSCFLAV